MKVSEWIVSSVPSSCINVFTGLHLHSSSTNFVKWQTSRFFSDFVLPRLHRWSSAALDCLPSATEPFRLPLLVYGTVCQSMSLLHHRWVSSSRASNATFLLFLTLYLLYSALAVTLSHFGHFSRSCYFPILLSLCTLNITWHGRWRSFPENLFTL